MTRPPVKLTFNQAYWERVILEHVLEKYGGVIGVKTIEEIAWNDYSLMCGQDGLEFSKKLPTPQTNISSKSK